MNPAKHNLSTRYVLAMRQLPQYECCIETGRASVTHAMTGVQIVPLGDVNDPHDTSGMLEVIYPGGHKATMMAGLFFKLALREAAQIEVDLYPGDFRLLVRSSVQKRISDLQEHLEMKHQISEG